MIRQFDKRMPHISNKAIVDELAVIIGNVSIHDFASVWPGAMIRGGKNAVIIEKNAAIMDRAFIEAHEKVVVGEGSIISHAAILHGSKIGKNVLVGIGAIILEVSIGDNSIVAAGSVVTKNFDENSFIAGIPAKRVRDVRKVEKKRIKETLEEIKENAKYLSHKK